MNIITKQEAKQQGLRRFFTGKPCKRGHVAERYVRSPGLCVECQSEHDREWRTADLDRMAARAALSNVRARYPDRIPPDFDYRTTIAFYAEARRLTRETGIPHEVDHVVAFSMGGLHIASNLQVITRKANREKGRWPT